MDLFKLLGTIAVDNSDANKALDETSGKGEKAQSKLSKAFSKIGRGAAVVGKAVATGLVAGGAAMGALTVKALNMSGELEQNMGGSEAVFGKYAGKMQTTAKNAFSNMGLSTSDYLATANKMGALFQGAGFSIKESMNLSSGAMQRAADVASIMGIDTSAAMEAIAGAAKGNFTMMDNLGVAMNDTTLQAYALEKGISKSTTEMTNQEKIGLAMEMFMEKTAYAARNYAKENETLAGSLSTAKAALTNFLDGSGGVDELVTSFTNAADVIIDNISKLAPRLISGITEIIGKVAPMIPTLLDQILPVIIDGAVSLINGLVAAMPAIISALMAALPALIQGIQQIINALIQALPNIIQALVSALPTLIPMLVDALVSMIVTLCTMLPQIIQPIIDYLPEVLITVVNALISNLDVLIQGAIQLVIGLVSALPQIIISLVDAMPTVITALVNGLISSAPTLIQGMKDIWNSVTTAVLTTFTGCKDRVVEIAGNIKDKAEEKFNQLKTKSGEIWGNIKTAASEKWGSIKSAVTEKAQGIKDGAEEKFNQLKTKSGEIWKNIKTAASEKWGSMKSSASTVFGSLRDNVAGIFSSIKGKMTQPIEKARDTIKGIVGRIEGFFSGMKLSLPKIKLPHFKVSGKLSISPPSVPKLSIDWYARAMNRPMIMNDPTIFGYNPKTGSFMGGGEAGSEVVSGTNILMKMIKSAVASENGVISYYLQKIIEILADYFPEFLNSLERDFVFDDGTMAAKLAPRMDKELGKIQDRKARGRA